MLRAQGCQVQLKMSADTVMAVSRGGQEGALAPAPLPGWQK